MIEKKMHLFVLYLLKETSKGNLRWQFDSQGRLRTICSIPLKLACEKRRHVYLSKGSDHIIVSISLEDEIGTKMSPVWDCPLGSADAHNLYEEAFKQQKEIEDFLNELGEDFDNVCEKEESVHWILNGINRVFKKKWL